MVTRARIIFAQRVNYTQLVALSKFEGHNKEPEDRLRADASISQRAHGPCRQDSSKANRSDHGTAISVGAEGLAQRTIELTIINNKFTNDQPGETVVFEICP